ncbi:MAG: ABC transporter permease subunit [Nitrososphaeria archaeon]
MPLSISFSTFETIAFPPRGFTLKWFYNIMEYETFVNGFVSSSVIALTASLLSMILSLPPSYVLYRYKGFKIKGLIENLFMLPMLIPEIVLSYLLLLFVYHALKIISLVSLIIGHTLVVLPYAMRIIYASISNLGIEIEDAAVSLGQNRFTAFFDVVLPNIRQGFVGSFLTCFMVSFNAVSISLFLSFGDYIPLPIAMLNYLQIRYDPTIAAISTLLVTFSALLSILVERIVGLVSWVR